MAGATRHRSRLYVLLESSARHDGDRLGEVGGRIVAEVLYGVIAADPESYLAVDPGWTPTLPARGATFRLADLLVPEVVAAASWGAAALGGGGRAVPATVRVQRSTSPFGQ